MKLFPSYRTFGKPISMNPAATQKLASILAEHFAQRSFSASLLCPRAGFAACGCSWASPKP
jgi:hypothetical protein